MSEKALAVVRFLLRAAMGVAIVAVLVVGLGVVLQALGASPDAGFAEWAYRNQDRLMGPFEGIFDDEAVSDSDAVIDVSGVFAVVCYAALLIPLGMGLGWIERSRARQEARRLEAKEAAIRNQRFGIEPEPVATRTIGERFGAVFGRSKRAADSPPADDA